VKEQITALSRGVDIVTGTPGRLNDLISTKHLDLSQVRFFVLDEADGLLSQGHSELISRIYQEIPKIGWDGKRLQMIVCSATLHSPDVKRLAERCMHFPTWIDLKGHDSVPETVHHVVNWVDPVKDTSWQGLKQSVQTDGVHKHDNIKPGSCSKETLSEAVKQLKVLYTLKAIQEHKMDQALIFCRTKLDCDNMEQFLLSKGGGPNAMVNEYSCVCLHSDRSPAQRRANLQAFKVEEKCMYHCGY
jgi:ATP-dependent RNA helicase DDX1